MVRTHALTAAALVVTMAATVAASAAPPCGRRDTVLEILAERYAETPIAVGVTKGGELLEVAASPDGATWSVVLTGPNGVACLLAAGEGWRARTLAADGPKA